MKTIAIFMLMMCLGLYNSYAQFTQGDKEYIGSIQFSVTDGSNSSGQSNTTSVTVTNRLGFLKKEHLSIGAYVSYNLYDYKCTGTKEIERTRHHYSGGLYVRRYFKLNRFTPFIESNLVYTRGQEKSTIVSLPVVSVSSPNKKTSHQVGLQVQGGLQFKINDWFSVEGLFDPFFTSNLYSINDADGFQNKSVGFNPNLSLSLSGVSIGARFKI